MKQLLLAATLALSLATPASAAVQTADRIVAVINNGVITLSELQQREAEITASLKRQNVALPPASVLSRQVLDLMVNEQLQLQYAASNGLRVKSDDLDSLQSRVGSLFGRSLELSNGMKAQPYVKASYITEHAGSSKVSVNGNKLDAELPGNRVELGFGGTIVPAGKTHNIIFTAYLNLPWIFFSFSSRGTQFHISSLYHL